jgi:hypothetical protein
MPTPTIPAGNLFMNATLYTGNGAVYPSSQSITNGVSGVSFQPDFVWIKSRSNAYSNFVFDVVRGAGKELVTNDTAAETNKNQLTTFNSNGFSVAVATDGSLGTNGSGSTFVGWQWKAGGTAVSNTSGTITSQVSANTTSGFSVVTYTGNGSSGATFGHGLGVTPSMIIIKNRGTSAAWAVNHASIGATQYLNLNTTGAVATDTTVFQNRSSTTVTIGTDGWVNGTSNTYVAYCWSEIAGFSKFGSYTGNGSTDGPFVYTNFRPKFVMIKRSDNVGDWYMLDTSRDPYNLVTQKLMADLSVAENGNGESTSTNTLDILSNGFKMRSTNTASNQSSGTYIYMAFAENPFKYANAR